MRQLLWAAAAALALAGTGRAADTKTDDAPACEGHGTTIDFMASPNAAAKEAAKKGKLVLVLHVSGNFEDPRFT